MFYFTNKLVRVVDFVRIIYLENNQIKIQMKDYHLILEGENFHINYFESKEIIVHGKLHNIKFE